MKVFTPYDIELTRRSADRFALKREMREAKFLVFQDSPGEGMQPEIFKRFWWWEDACNEVDPGQVRHPHGEEELRGARAEAKAVSDADARDGAEPPPVPCEGMSASARCCRP